MNKEAMTLATEFNKYFTSMDGMAGQRVSVPRDEWRALFAALAEQPEQEPAQEAIGYEKYKAIREGHQNACEEAYFGARPDLPLNRDTLWTFRAGFVRGYDVAAAAQQPAQPQPLDDDADPMLGQARELVLRTRRASISLVQRHLMIGYNRASRLMEALESVGVVSPMDSNGNREVIGGAK